MIQRERFLAALFVMSREEHMKARWLEWTDRQSVPVEIEALAESLFQGGYIAACQDVLSITEVDEV